MLCAALCCSVAQGRWGRLAHRQPGQLSSAQLFFTARFDFKSKQGYKKSSPQNDTKTTRRRQLHA